MSKQLSLAGKAGAGYCPLAARRERIRRDAEPAPPEEAVSVEMFQDDDRGYAAWLAANGRGFVLNIQRSMTPSDARVHEAGCQTISGTPPRGRLWTGTYVKACSTSLAELDGWAQSRTGSPITRCGTCQP